MSTARSGGAVTGNCVPFPARYRLRRTLPVTVKPMVKVGISLLVTAVTASFRYKVYKKNKKRDLPYLRISIGNFLKPPLSAVTTVFPLVRVGFVAVTRYRLPYISSKDTSTRVNVTVFAVLQCYDPGNAVRIDPD